MKHPASRRSDSGTITIMAFFLLTSLIGMAGLAVDVGFMYTRSRMIYAVADSAVAAGMTDLVANNAASISGDISALAGQYGGAYTFHIDTQNNTTLQLTVSATYPLFFGKMLGFPSKAMHVQVTGSRPVPSPPILALGNTCGTGVTINGQGTLQVDGDIQSNGSVTFLTGSPGPDVQGNVTAGCGPVTKNPWDTVTGTVGTGGPFTDPYAPFTPPTCTVGSTVTDLNSVGNLAHYWDNSTTPPNLPAGVYCSSGNLQLIDPGNGFNALGVTLVSVGGTISIQVNKTTTITPNGASPDGIIAYSTASTGTFPGDIAVTGPGGPPPYPVLSMLGSFYAPNGTVNIQQNGTWKAGDIVANNVWIGDNNSWEVGVGAAAGPNAWQMSQ